MQSHNKILHAITSCISYFLCFLIGMVCFVPLLLLVAILPLGKRLHSRTIFRFLHIIYRGLLKAMFIPVSISGKEHLANLPQAIFVANHESSLDIAALGMLMEGHPHLWYVFIRFASTPILGFFVRRMTVIVNQDSPREAATALLQGIRLVEKYHVHTLIFPEGGRFNKGTVHDFSHGFAMIAKRTGQPVVPVKLCNLGKVYPPHSFLIYPQQVYIKIGAPCYFTEHDTEETFTHCVQRWFTVTD